MAISLEETIKYFDEDATVNENLSSVYKGYDEDMEMMHKEDAERSSCVAEWLRELKKYRIAHWKLRDMDYEYDFNSMFGKNPMYYGENVWDLFGDIDASVEYEVMGYEEVNADDA